MGSGQILTPAELFAQGLLLAWKWIWLAFHDSIEEKNLLGVASFSKKVVIGFLY